MKGIDMIEQLINFKTFKKTADFHSVMSNGIDSYSNYSGPDYQGWLCGPTETRDSEILAISNFHSALERLGGESKDVQVVRFDHWGCGWFNRILVKATSSKAKELYQIYKDLETYPVLDEDDFSERESEYQADYAESAKVELSQALSKHFGLKDTKALRSIAVELNITCQGYYGNDSCISIYSCRVPDKRDIEQLRICLREVERFFRNSRLYKTLVQRIESFIAAE